MKNKAMWLILGILGAILCASLLLMGKSQEEPKPEETQAVQQIHLDEVDTWEEYKALSPEEQEAFYQKFGSAEAFEEWMESVKPSETTMPDFIWEKEGKQPDAYTWEEYQALSLEEQEAFYRWFDTEEAFEAWLESARKAEATVPVMQWNKTGKKPDQYTWEEYQALSPEEQEAFFQWFETEAAFEAWMKKTQPQETTAPATYWNKPGKSPSEYTWEEYEALSPEDQEAFYRWFGNKKTFETWMESVKPAETTAPVRNWDKPGKSPSEYTWQEYEALSPEDQEAFYHWFDSQKAFEAWMDGVKSQETEPEELTWDKPGKTPDAYTWEEYQALTPMEQDAFYRWFGSMEAFEAWMAAAKPKESQPAVEVWNKPGKKPDAYTWEEYQALSPEDQDLFFEWFGSVEAFEAWMEEAKALSAKTWKKPGKLPDQYTKEEYLALTPEEQDAFFQWFDTMEAFEAWVEWAEGQT